MTMMSEGQFATSYEQKVEAVKVVAAHAHDASDLEELLEALGLDTRPLAQDAWEALTAGHGADRVLP